MIWLRFFKDHLSFLGSKRNSRLFVVVLIFISQSLKKYGKKLKVQYISKFGIHLNLHCFLYFLAGIKKNASKSASGVNNNINIWKEVFPIDYWFCYMFGGQEFWFILPLTISYIPEDVSPKLHIANWPCSYRPTVYCAFLHLYVYTIVFNY